MKYLLYPILTLSLFLNCVSVSESESNKEVSNTTETKIEKTKDDDLTSYNDLSLNLKKEIYYELVLEQDNGTDDEKAYQIIANRYDLPLSYIQKIAIDGSIEMWPIP